MGISILPFLSAASYFVLVATIAAFTGQHVVRKIIAVLGRTSIIIFILALTIFVSAISLGKRFSSFFDLIWKLQLHFWRIAQNYSFSNHILQVVWASKTWLRSWRIKNTWDSKIFVTNPEFYWYSSVSRLLSLTTFSFTVTYFVHLFSSKGYGFTYVSRHSYTVPVSAKTSPAKFHYVYFFILPAYYL